MAGTTTVSQVLLIILVLALLVGIILSGLLLIHRSEGFAHKKPATLGESHMPGLLATLPSNTIKYAINAIPTPS